MRNDFTATLPTLDPGRDDLDGLYGAVFASAAVGIVLGAEDGRVLATNRALQEMLGYTEEELLTTPVAQLTFPDDYPRDLELFQEVLSRQRTQYQLEKRYLRKDGRVFWGRLTVSRQMRPSGSGAFLIGMIEDISARKQAEEARRESEARFQALVEHSWDAIALLAPNGTAAYVTPAVEAILGYRPDDFVGRVMFDLMHPDDLPVGRGVLEQVLEKPDRPAQATVRFRRADGSWRWLEGRLTNLLDEPSVRAVVVNFRDRTAQEEADSGLRDSEERYRSLFESATDIVYRHDPAGNLLLWNAAGERILGYSRDEIARMNIAQIIVPDQVPLARRMTAHKVADGGQTAYELDVLAKDGRRVALEIRSELVQLPGRPPVIQGIARDITERKQAAEALRASEAKYRALVENLEQSVFLKDHAFRFVAANRRFCEGLGRAEADLVGKTDFDVYPPELARKYRADDQQVLTAGTRLEREEETVLGKQRHLVRVVKTPVFDAPGEPAGVLGIFWDVTDQRLWEEQLRQSQKMEAIGRLAGGVAHDFNNLLTVITGYGEILLGKLRPTDAAYEAARNIVQASARASSLTQQLLAFSRRQILQPVTLNLNDIVAEAGTMLRRVIGEDVELITALDPRLGVVKADAGQMHQVILNLAVNARDAMPSGGTLTIATRPTVLDGTLDGRPDLPRGAYVQLSISDTGCGMDDETKARAFEPFFTTKEVGKGTGLGLATVYGIVKQSGGHIEVSTLLGHGTTFHVYLPCHNAALPARASDPDRYTLPPGTETVLLVEDDASVRGMARHVLQLQGYKVLDAGNGADALRLSREHAGPIHLLLTDLVMPKMSGRQLAANLLPERPALQVLYVSGYTDDAVVLAGLDSGTAFLQKPFTPTSLARKVRDVLDRPGQGEAEQGGTI